MSALRVGAVSFLNTVPLIEGLDGEADVEVVRDLPSRLADRLRDGTLDVGLVPAVEYLRGLGGDLVPGLCLGARGAVRTVKIFSRIPLREVERVSVDRGSRSSVALMNVLFAELHGRQPEIEEFEPRPETLFDRCDTALVIGDRADAIDGDGLYVHDLGELWFELTGLPFVFAGWVLSASLVDPVRRRRVIDVLHRAFDRGWSDLDSLARREAALRGTDAYAVTSYWREFIQYRLGAEEIRGLERFAELAARHGQIETTRRVAIAEA